MIRRGCVWLLLVHLPSIVWAQAAYDHAQRAQALLSADTWSQVLHITNTARESVYPRQVYALVFELGGLLWFYTSTDGTQSLSLHQHNLAAEKANLARLLRAIEPGFIRHRVLPRRHRAGSAKASEPLPNGCLLQSYAHLRERLERGEDIRAARLLSYYYWFQGSRRGHTVLLYETAAGSFIVDPLRPERVQPIAGPIEGEALAVALRLELPPTAIASARWVPTPFRAAALAAADEPATAPATPTWTAEVRRGVTAAWAKDEREPRHEARPPRDRETAHGSSASTSDDSPAQRADRHQDCDPAVEC